MPLGKKTWIYTKSVVMLERDEYGVYELLDSLGNVLYIGYGKIVSSLLQHLEDGKDIIPGAVRFSVEYTWDEDNTKKRYDEEMIWFYKSHKRNPEFNH